MQHVHYLVCHAEQHLLAVCKRPGMYISGDSIEQTAAYIQGYDDARDGGPLLGLREWLVVQGAIGDNQGWAAVVTPPHPDPPLADTPSALGQLLNAFFERRREGGMMRLQMEYARWHMRRGSYDGPLRYSKNLRGSGEA